MIFGYRDSGKRTSLRLEPEFAAALAEYAAQNRMTVPCAITRIDQQRGDRPLSSYMRVFLLQHARGKNNGGTDG